jgi:PAS domain S-box-containing protein
MLTASETLRLSVNIQLLLTVFLVVLLWALYARFRGFEFFRWWAWAWTAFAVYLGTATISLHVGPAWTPLKASLVFALLLSGFLEIALLVFGGLSWRAPHKLGRRVFWMGIGLAIVAASVCYFLGYHWRAIPVASMAVRNLSRTLALALALLFCVQVFWRQFRLNLSVAAAITGTFCFAYAIDQFLYFMAFAEVVSKFWGRPFPPMLHDLANIEFLSHNRLLFLDLLDTCGICLGMILLLVERHKQTESELEASEQRSLGLAADNVSLHLEIQKRLRSEQELRRSEELSRQIVLYSPAAMLVSRAPSEEALLVNERFSNLFGYTLEDFHNVSEWWPIAYPDPAYRQAIQSQWQALLDKAKRGCTDIESMEARVRCKNGSLRDIEFHLSRLGDLYLVSFVDLTERKRIEGQLRESESRYRDLVENSEDLLGTHDLEGRILSINPAPCRRLGYEVEEVLRMNMRDLLAPRFRDLYPAFAERVLRNGQDKGYMVVITKNGEERVWEYTSTLRSTGVSAPVIRGMAHDVTERFRAQEALRLSEQKFETAFRASPHAMTISSLRDGRFLDVNASFERQSGFSREEIIGKTVLEIGLWADSADFAAIMADSLHRRKVTGRAVRLRTKSGRFVNALYSVEVIDLNGEPCALAAGEDVTERFEMEKALRESEAKFRLVADTVTSAIWLLQDDHFVYFNKEFEAISGYSRDEILSMSPWDLVHPDFREEARARASLRLRGEPVPNRYQFAVLTKSGEARWVEFSAALTELNGKPAILASAFDITATKRTEQELKEHLMYMDALIANSPLGIVIKDQNQLVRFCNPAFERMFFYTQGEIQGKNLDDLIASHDKPEAARLSEAVTAGGVVHATTQRCRKDGTLIDVELHGVKVYSGVVFVGAFAIYQDITERKRSEEKLAALRKRLARAQEEERARIARDLHDDAGQRLALLNIDLERLKQASVKLKSSLTDELEALAKAAGEIASDVHNVSRRLHPSQVELLGLPKALDNFCKDYAARNSMEITFLDGRPQGKLPQDASLCLFRVAQEAIRNAHKHSGCSRALVQLDETGGSLRLRVSDEGTGFDPTSIETNPGLGLLSMEERLHSLGGELFINARPGDGTCIEACIPLSGTKPPDGLGAGIFGLERGKKEGRRSVQ